AYNQQGALTATLKDEGGANIAGATVTFKVDNGTGMTATTNASGVATLSYTPTMAPGNYPITVDFAATTYYNAAPQATATLTVTKAATTLSTTSQTIQYGAQVTLTATLLSGGNGVEGKTITFKVNNVIVGTGTTLASGTATFTYTPTLSPGSYSVNADFATDTYYLAATAPAQTLTVVKADTTVMPNTGLTVVYGQTINLTGTLTRADNGATIGGMPIEFKVGGSTLAPLVNTNGSGVATYVWTANLPAGTYAFEVGWSGNTDYNGDSGSTTLTVTKATPLLTVPSQTINYSQTVTLTATLTGAAGAALTSQPITFKVNGVTVGSASTDNNGTAYFIYTPSSAGNHTVTAEFAGNTMYNAGFGSGTLTVNKLATLLTLTPATRTINYGGAPNFTANLKETVYNGNLAGQTITFSDGTNTCTAVTDNAGNAVSCLASPNPGTYTITASFGGTVNYQAAANDTSTLTVNKSNARLEAFDYAIDRQDFTTFTFTGRLTRTSDGAGLSGVTVRLTMSGTPTHQCTGVTDANGFVTCTVNNGGVSNGTRTLTPSVVSGYPTTFYNTPTIVTASVYITNNALQQTMTLTATPATVQFTDTVTLRATVTPVRSGQTVTFMQGSTTLGTATTNGAGVATLTVQVTDPASTIVAIAEALGGYTGAMNTTTISVTKEDVTLAYTGDISLSGPSTPVTLKARIIEDADGSLAPDITFGGTVQVQFRVQSISTGVYDNTFTANIDATGLAQTQIYIAQGSYRVTTSMVTNPYLKDPGTVTTDILQAGTGVGLWGQYYIDQIPPYNASFPGPKQWEQLSMSRIDPEIDFTWGTSNPDTQVTQNTNYSIRWTGQVQPFYTENYTFCVQANDGVQLWINGVQRLAGSAWNSQGATIGSDEFCTAPISMTAGTLTDIRLEYWQNIAHAEVHLYWQSASQPKEIIPHTQLYPVASFTSNLGLRGQYYQSVSANTGSANPTFTYPGTNLRFIRNDGNISFLWNDNVNVTPGPGMGDEYYLIRWTGYWTPSKNINRICVNSDDGIKVWIDGVLRLSVWNLHAPQWDCVNLPSTLAAGTTHSIQMEYYEHTGNSYIAFAGLTTAGATPSAADVIPVGEFTLPSGGQPATPSVPTVTGIGNYQARLTWTWQNPVSTPMVTSYVIYRSTDPSFTPSNATMVGTTGPGSSGTPPSFIDSNLISGTTYYYKIVALDSSGNASTATAATAAYTQP
ncbi:MAG TPA: Ig-like domain repeat protein, partial [Symbiobacteriaceae bacterium]|nr:Ig-like domain repeat protein [Symbiobacteriaceae bacterium]